MISRARSSLSPSPMAFGTSTVSIMAWESMARSGPTNSRKSFSALAAREASYSLRRCGSLRMRRALRRVSLRYSINPASFEVRMDCSLRICVL
ncbi:MAG: hypothetical protein D6731_26255 [Planctomycetota bacterium]|nr:MAG: hypothetical protein D6731_26255 [Planctomycetota bacterium]